MCRTLKLVLVGICVASGLLYARPVQAVKQFQRQFEAKYIQPGDQPSIDRGLAATVRDAKCAICHVSGSKKKLNAYGQQLRQLVHKKDAQDQQKVFAAFDRVASLKSDPKDTQSPTFGELIREGKLLWARAK